MYRKDSKKTAFFLQKTLKSLLILWFSILLEFTP